MYKVLLVDDDPAICEGLPLLIDWTALRFEVAVTAADGQIALNVLLDSPVDLIVTDIRMPKLDGIDLIKEIRSRGLEVPVVIISGHKDFEYAQTAMAFGVRHYLLKPVNAQMLVSTLVEIRHELDDRARIERTVHESLQVLRQRQVWELLNQPPLEKQNVQEGWPASTSIRTPYRVMIVAVQGITQTAAHQLLESMPSDHPFNWMDWPPIDLEKGRIAVVCRQPELDRDKAFDLAGKIWQQFADALGSGHSIQVMVGRQVQDPHELSISYADALDLLSNGKDESAQPVSIYEDRQSSQLLESILTYIRLHYMEKISLRQLALDFYLNPAYLGRLIRKHTGRSFNDYLAVLRVKQAQQLLKNRKLTVMEVAERVGYADHDYFCQVFRQWTGQTPSDYRLQDHHG